MLVGVCRSNKALLPPKLHSLPHLPKVYAVLDVFGMFRSRNTLEAGVIREIGICSERSVVKIITSGFDAWITEVLYLTDARKV